MECDSENVMPLIKFHLRLSKAVVSRAAVTATDDRSLADGGVDVLEATATPLSSSSSLCALMAVRFSVDRALDVDTPDSGRGLLRYPKKMLRKERRG